MINNSLRIKYDQKLRDLSEFINDDLKYDRVVNTYAIQGAGKSHFLVDLRDRLKADSVKDWQTSYIQISSADFNLQELMRKLANDFAIPLSSSQEDSTLIEEEPVGQQIAAWLDERMQQQHNPKLLLIVDDYDLIPSDERKQIEDWVLSRLIKLSIRSVAVLSSQQPLEFNNRLDVTSRLYPFELKGVNVQDIENVLGKPYEQWAPYIQKLSNGLPRLVELLVQEVHRNPNSPKSVGATIMDLPESYREDYRVKLRQVSFSKSPDIDERVVEALDTLSLLRRFDVSILRNLLPIIDPVHYENKTQGDILNLIRDLGSRIQWRTDGGGYTLDPMLKVMLSSYIRAFQPNYFNTVQVNMMNVCEHLLAHRYNINHLVELGYHTWEHNSKKTRSDRQRAIKVNEVFNRYLDGPTETRVPPYTWDIDMLDLLERALTNDEVLSKVVGETIAKIRKMKETSEADIPAIVAL